MVPLYLEKRLLMILAIISILTFDLSAVKNTRLFNNPQMMVAQYNSIQADSASYLWIASMYGPRRFDGANVDSYRYNETDPTSISDNRVLKTPIDREGHLWAATANGLNLYNPDTRLKLRGKYTSAQDQYDKSDSTPLEKPHNRKCDKIESK